MFEIKIEKNYLWFPVKNKNAYVKIHIFSQQQKIYELDIQAADEFDFYAGWNVTDYIGKTLTFSGEIPQAWFAQIKQENQMPAGSQKRPNIHFASQIGWINDPNGMIYHNGIYHMYFQHNPYGIEWGNMHWGHAYSTDLFHWKQTDEVLYPDDTGTMYSGSAITDVQNVAGFGANTILYYYTAAAMQNDWAKDKDTTQRLAYSTDNGKTLIKSDKFVLEHIIDENRDPKVFYHAQSNGYIMVLYLTKNDFAIYRSDNLLEWKQTQTLTLPEAWECPDLVCLAVDGNPKNHRWIFWSADGFYFIGDFDGYCFTPTSQRLYAYANRLGYAAQTYSGIQDRVISQTWLRTKNHNDTYTGLMGIPVELGIKTTTYGERLTLTPVRELKNFRKEKICLSDLQNDKLMTVNDQSVELIFEFEQVQSGTANLTLLNAQLQIDFANGTVRFADDSFHFCNDTSLSLHIYLDYDVIEIFAQDDTIYFPCEYHGGLSGDILLDRKGDCHLQSAQIYILDSNH